ncbi:CLUMA_CG015493, isoform A [Clunio marinus]|uniref:CLUMA_CG015493, isoform A n=1 Tax=Clunio marinus TaxID=568069 RepID=A0A1J1IPD4_9DIPT|nr:CLUMA_CG015493, isoform A [Clunio marinus]
MAQTSVTSLSPLNKMSGRMQNATAVLFGKTASDDEVKREQKSTEKEKRKEKKTNPKPFLVLKFKSHRLWSNDKRLQRKSLQNTLKPKINDLET